MCSNTRPPNWHYVGMTGIYEWFSKIHEAVIKDRIRRVDIANEVDGRAMRFCHCCEGTIGTMTRKTYMFLYINLGRKCPVCGNKAFNPEGVWIGEKTMKKEIWSWREQGNIRTTIK